MPHSIIYNLETGFVEAKVYGLINLIEIKEIQSEAIRVLMENNVFLYFGDYREAKLNLSTMEIYDIPKLLSNAFTSVERNIHKLKRAIVIVKDFEDYKFFENITFNQGQSAKLFYDVDEAKKWLAGK